MSPTVHDLFSSPDHYLHSFDGPDAIFVPMDADAYRRSIFLDDRIMPASEAAWRVPVEALVAGEQAPQSEIAWIFHVAHCGSTLLARALGELSDTLVLREPLALRQAAVGGDQRALHLTLRMLAKRYPGGATPIVKANVPVNFVIPEIASVMPDAPAIFLYYGFEDYLLSILRSDNHRAWLRRVSHELAPKLAQGRATSDAERAASLWLAQLRAFAGGLAAMPRGRSLDAERFFADPGSVLSAVRALCGLSYDEQRIEAEVRSELFETYAKNPSVAFENRDRVRRRDKLRGLLAREIGEARGWLDKYAKDESDMTAMLARRALV